MATIHCTRKELQKGLKVPLDERTKIVVGPDAAVATIVGRLFDFGKNFPLPRGLDALRGVFGFGLSLRAPKAALVVAHVDADVEDAEGQSLGRAEILAAWLKNDAQPWLDQYAESVPAEARWGPREDHAILRQLPDVLQSAASLNAAGANSGQAKPRDEVIRSYQRLRGLAADGVAGPKTRAQLVKDYFEMSHQVELATAGDTASENAGSGGAGAEPPKLDLDVASHGAGANFTLQDVARAREAALLEANGETSPKAEPQSDAGEPKSATPAAAAPSEASLAGSPSNERVDFFFFFGSQGVDPAPAAVDGEEYLRWIELTHVDKLFHVGGSDGKFGSQLSMQLYDKSGTQKHAKQRFSISGPDRFEGFTDGRGRLNYEDVQPGDYSLKLSLEFFDEPHRVVDEYTCPVVVTPSNRKPQIRLIGAAPRCILARLKGLLFDTNKAFLLPTAMPDLRDIRELYEANNPSRLLVVGHTDTTGTPATNDSLSLERARATLAFLEDDVDAWLEFYSQGVQESRRWGSTEDLDMLGAVLGQEDPATEEQLRQFQTDHSLSDNPTGDATRRLLVTRYMALDGAELDSSEFTIQGTAHGCGENFPLDDSGEALDDAPEDEKDDALDRRVELFFFDSEFGIVPPPKGKNSAKGSQEYPQWRKQAALALERVPLGPRPTLELRLYDDERQLMPNAPYRILLPDDKVKVGRADERGVVLLQRAGGHDQIEIQWGQRELGEEVEVVEESPTGDQTPTEQPLPEPPTDAEAARAFFAFAATLKLSESPNRIAIQLQNLGHVGDEVAQRERFRAFYLASDDSLIDDVYLNGKSA